MPVMNPTTKVDPKKKKKKKSFLDRIFRKPTGKEDITVEGAADKIRKRKKMLEEAAK